MSNFFACIRSALLLIGLLLIFSLLTAIDAKAELLIVSTNQEVIWTWTVDQGDARFPDVPVMNFTSYQGSYYLPFYMRACGAELTYINAHVPGAVTVTKPRTGDFGNLACQVWIGEQAMSLYSTLNWNAKNKVKHALE